MVAMAMIGAWSRVQLPWQSTFGGQAWAAKLHHPRRYIAPRGTITNIDGDVFKPEWENIPWSEEFVEIRGADAPSGTGPTPDQATRVKMLWDDEYLYIAALMDLREGQELVAKFTQRNSPIFHTDVDFEVFVDAPGCCHNYKELEMNAINTVWNLMLDKPYMDGGGEFSGREHKPGHERYWEVRSQRTATRVLKGALHDPSRPSRWCCEIALAHVDTLDRLPVGHAPPSVGRFWRINFSRVEQKGQVNWVWTPQVVWDPETLSYSGKVNMHLPDAYGYVVFADKNGKVPGGTFRDPAWLARLGASGIYYAARKYREDKGRYPTSLADVDGLVDSSLLAQMKASITSEDATQGYRAIVEGFGWTVTVDHTRFMTCESGRAKG